MIETNARKLDTVLNGCLALMVLNRSSVLLILNGCMVAGTKGVANARHIGTEVGLQP